MNDGGPREPTPPPSTPTSRAHERAVALATGAILTESNRDDHEYLGGGPRVASFVRRARRILVDSWGIESAEELRDTYDSLLEEGHSAEYEEARLTYETARDPARFEHIVVATCQARIGERRLKAWDLGRAVSVAGWGYAAGLLDEEEAWERVVRAARLTREHYTSWQHFAEHYEIGRWFWAKKSLAASPAIARLFAAEDSPWRRLPWALEEPAPAPAPAPRTSGVSGAEPPIPRLVHEAAPKTQQDRLALAVLGLSAPVDNECLDYLGAVALRPHARGAAASYFAPDPTAAGAERVVRQWATWEPTADLDYLRAAATASPEDNQQRGAAHESRVAFFKELGEGDFVKAVHAWRAMNCARAVQRAYAGGLLSYGDAWAFLRHSLARVRAHIASWEELERYGQLGLRYVRASGGPAHPYHLLAGERLLHAPDSPWRTIPWGLVLGVNDRVPPPSLHLAVTLRTTIECPHCGKGGHVERAGASFACDACGETRAVSADLFCAFWTDALFDARLWREPRLHHLACDDALEARITWEHRAPACPRCEASIDLEPLRHTRELAVSLPCTACGERVGARRPDALTVPVDPCLEWIVGEAPDGAASDASEAPLTSEPLVIGCLRCGAPVRVDGTDRAPRCEACGVLSFCSPALWRRFHPARRARPITFLLAPAMARIDVPCRPPLVALTGGMLFGTLESDYHALFEVVGDRPPARLRPQRTASRALLWMLALGAVDTHLTGSDHGRLGGVPRTVAYRVNEAPTLTARLANATPEGMSEALSAKLGRGALTTAARERVTLTGLAFLMGWIDEEAAARALRPVAAKVQKKYRSWPAYAAAHRAVKGGPSQDAIHAACTELLADPCSPWRTLPWDLDLDGDATTDAPDADGPLEAIRVRASVGCPLCRAEVPVDDLTDEAICPACDARVDVSLEPWSERLEQAVFTARQLEEGVSDRINDHRDDGSWHLDVTRGEPSCPSCEAAMPLAEIGLEAGDGERACPSCRAPLSVRLATAADRAIDPRARYVVSGAPPGPKVHGALSVSCASCGAPHEADGTTRVLVCQHCGAHGWMSDKDWLRFHPAARRRGFHLVVAKNRRALGALRMPDWDDSIVRSFVIRGVPATTEGHALPTPPGKLAEGRAEVSS